LTAPHTGTGALAPADSDQSEPSIFRIYAGVKAPVPMFCIRWIVPV